MERRSLPLAFGFRTARMLIPEEKTRKIERMTKTLLPCRMERGAAE